MIDYNVEVVLRKGYWKGSLDRRGLRYVNIAKCGTYNCGNDAKLAWYYEDDCYYECEECWVDLCDHCINEHPEIEGASICIDCKIEKENLKDEERWNSE